MREWTQEDISKLRQRLKLSQTAFAALLGVTRIYVYYLEKGVKRPGKTLTLLLDCIEKEKGKGVKKRHGKA